ncbi:hypothetical protein [Bacteroides mediterraneensis]|uniref:Uncharacterized protein n=1 Tax=Bacteroides mediterraneensis TaxID=1841856 RepID=A0ABS2EYR9_9BACE|nr:hypothetical protein [Bacteroides mediterraneensis]MBM6759458.1 hypothetical protein [Bacteroides mediterraneensis]
MKLPKYASQPSVSNWGKYEVALYSEKDNDYIPIKGELYLVEEQAKDRAKELNRMVEEDSEQND